MEVFGFDAGEGPLDYVALQARAALRAHLGLVWVFTTHWQFFVGASGLEQPYRRTRRVPLVESFCQHAREIGAQLIVPDISAYPSLARHPIGQQLGLTSYAAWPITGTAAGSAVGADPGDVGLNVDLGAVCVFDQVPRDWSTTEITLLETIARQNALALQDLVNAVDSTAIRPHNH